MVQSSVKMGSLFLFLGIFFTFSPIGCQAYQRDNWILDDDHRVLESSEADINAFQRLSFKPSEKELESSFREQSPSDRSNGNSMDSTSREDLFDFLDAWGERREDTGDSMWTPMDGKPTLTKMHYLILPIWWEDETTQPPVDIAAIEGVMAETIEYYKEMSWNKHEISYEILDQVTLEGVSKVAPTFGNTQEATRNHINNLNPRRVKFEDYTGIIMMHSRADSGPFDGGGGWANINSDFIWMAFPGNFYVARHEIGHNYGHPHHIANTYDWRTNRGYDSPALDRWDMMSGGNGYARSDLAAASKWSYNWITDEAVVMMQPDGSNSACPSCLAAVTGLELKAFDDPSVEPSSTDMMAIHIPVAKSGNSVFSYWLSYRGFGNDGLAAGGLSIHMTEFSLGGMFGATSYSQNFNAFGDRERDMSNAFVVPETCYIVAPPGRMFDIVPKSADEIQPIVCVDSVDAGNKITVSVSFMDVASPKAPTISLDTDEELGCNGSGALSGDFNLDVSAGKTHLFRYTSTGKDGLIDLNLCVSSGARLSAKAYFYDTYPYSYMAFDAPAAYGSFRSLDVSTMCSDGFSMKSYTSEYDETYVLVVGNADSSVGNEVLMNSVCTISNCSVNQYLQGSNQLCKKCPEGSVSPDGSTGLASCSSCSQNGMEVFHPKSPVCVLPDTVSGLFTGSQWRLFTTRSLTLEGWRWDISDLSFYTSLDCAPESKIDASDGAPFDSGNANSSWGPENAFDRPGRTWGGRRDADDFFYLGMEFPSEVTVKCINVEQRQATKFYVQTRENADGEWNNVWIENNASEERVDIPFLVPTNSPSATPSLTPSLAPTSFVPTVSAPTGSQGVDEPTPDKPRKICFSGRASVQVEHQSVPIPVSDLQIGDRVLTGKLRYQPVYAFGHYNRDENASFMEITTNRTTAALEISHEHLVFVRGDQGPVRADSIKVGDELIGALSDGLFETSTAVVTKIATVQRTGVYAPLTSDGTIVVDGIVASNYVSIQSRHNEYIELRNGFSLPLLEVDLVHMWLSPLRLACKNMSSQFCKMHNDEGMLRYVAFGFDFISWGETQHVVVQVLALTIVLMLTLFSLALEYMFETATGLLLLVAVVASTKKLQYSVGFKKNEPPIL